MTVRGLGRSPRRPCTYARGIYGSRALTTGAARPSNINLYIIHCRPCCNLFVVGCLTTGPCEPTSWTRYPDTNVYDGAPHPPSTTLPVCQSACVANSSCTAIDWDDSSSEKCWHHGPWSAGNQMNSASGVQHYRLTRRYCDGKREMCI